MQIVQQDGASVAAWSHLTAQSVRFSPVLFSYFISCLLLLNRTVHCRQQKRLFRSSWKLTCSIRISIICAHYYVSGLYPWRYQTHFFLLPSADTSCQSEPPQYTVWKLAFFHVSPSVYPTVCRNLCKRVLPCWTSSWRRFEIRQTRRRAGKLRHVTDLYVTTTNNLHISHSSLRQCAVAFMVTGYVFCLGTHELHTEAR
jgi:hypothetical protein